MQSPITEVHWGKQSYLGPCCAACPQGLRQQQQRLSAANKPLLPQVQLLPDTAQGCLCLHSDPPPHALAGLISGACCQELLDQSFVQSF